MAVARGRVQVLQGARLRVRSLCLLCVPRCLARVCAGIFMPVEAVDDALEEECFRTNLVGAHFLTKFALPLLLASPYSAAPAPAAAAAAGGDAAARSSGAAAPAAGSEGAAAAAGSAAPPAMPRRDIERTVVYVSSSAGFLEEPEEGNGMLAYRASKAGENGLMVGLHQLYVADSETAVRTRGGPAAPRLQRVVAGTWLPHSGAARDACCGGCRVYAGLRLVVAAAAVDGIFTLKLCVECLPFLLLGACLFSPTPLLSPVCSLQCTPASCRRAWGWRQTPTSRTPRPSPPPRRDGAPSRWRRARTRCCGPSPLRMASCRAASCTTSARCTRFEPQGLKTSSCGKLHHSRRLHFF